MANRDNHFHFNCHYRICIQNYAVTSTFIGLIKLVNNELYDAALGNPFMDINTCTVSARHMHYNN